MNKAQKGFIPVLVLVAMAISAVVGAFLGYQLGDGTFFSMGFGLGLALISAGFIYRFLKPMVEDFKAKK